MTATRFLRTALLSAALMVIGFVVETMIVDPYDYWGLSRLEGVNSYKPKVHSHLKIAKTGQYLREQPRTVLAGNSRVDVGIDPRDTAWPAAMQPVYNFGMPGQGMASVAETLTTVMAEHRPRRIFLGVDFLDFLMTRELWTGFEDRPLAARRPTLREQMQGLAQTTFSLDALVDSALTVLEQNKAYPADTRRDGFTPLEDYYAHVEQEGHAALFEQRSRETVQRLLAQPRRMEWPLPGNNPAWVRLEQFLAHARAQGVEVVLFTYPYHAELLESLRQTGKWEELRRWQARLAAVAAKEGATLWSFLGYNDYTTEAVPKAGDRTTHMQWYWEAGHFKPALGGLMLARMLEDYDAPADFGRKLTPGTVGAAFAALEAEGELYRARPNASTRRVAAYVRAHGGVQLVGAVQSVPELSASQEVQTVAQVKKM